MAHARLLKRSRRRPLDGEDNVLASSDDTIDDENPGPEPEPWRRDTLCKRRTNAFPASSGLLISDPFGIERHSAHSRLHTAPPLQRRPNPHPRPVFCSTPQSFPDLPAATFASVDPRLVSALHVPNKSTPIFA